MLDSSSWRSVVSILEVPHSPAWSSGANVLSLQDRVG